MDYLTREELKLRAEDELKRKKERVIELKKELAEAIAKLPKRPGMPRKAVDIAKAGEMAARGLHPTEIAACLGISRDLYYDHLKDDPEFRDAIERGRAIGVNLISEIPMNIALDPMAEDRDRLKAAEMYLKRHGKDWKDPEKTTLSVEHSGGIETTVLTQEDMLRAAQTYVHLNGVPAQDDELDDADDGPGSEG